MGKKMMKLPFLLKPEPSSSSSSWPWPTCGNPTKTLSVRATTTTEPPPPLTELEEDSADIESVIQGLRSERLFFEPGETSSILEEAKAKEEEGVVVVHEAVQAVPFKESVAMEMESKDPYLDFKKSMVEMVEADDRLKKGSWEGLQELLSWYLAVNGKSNHGYIIGAFVDLLVNLAAKNSSTNSIISIGDDQDEGNNDNSLSDSNLISPSPVSALSFTSSSSSTCSASPCLSYLLEEEEEEEEAEDEREKTLLVIDINASSS